MCLVNLLPAWVKRLGTIDTKQWNFKQKNPWEFGFIVLRETKDKGCARPLHLRGFKSGSKVCINYPISKFLPIRSYQGMLWLLWYLTLDIVAEWVKLIYYILNITWLNLVYIRKRCYVRRESWGNFHPSFYLEVLHYS